MLAGPRCFREQFFPWFDVALVWIFTFTSLDVLRADFWCFLVDFSDRAHFEYISSFEASGTWRLPYGYKPPGHLGEGEAYWGTLTVEVYIVVICQKIS